MTKLYLPTLIRDSAHAASLPEGTVLIKEGNHPAAIYEQGQSWFDGRDDGEPWPLALLAAEGWTALVPVEAKEEWGMSWPEDGGAYFTFDNETTARRMDAENAAHGWPGVLIRHVSLPWAPVEDA